MNPIIYIILITLIPALELRASIPYGILVAKMNWIEVFIICVLANFVLGIVVYFFMEEIVKIFTINKKIGKIWNKYVKKAQKKIHPNIEKYGVWGVGIFIGIPLPGTGVYTAAVGSYFLGFEWKEWIVANALGVIIAGIAVTAVVLSGSNGFEWVLTKL